MLYSFFNLTAKSGGWSTPSPGHFTYGNDSVPILYEDWMAPGPVWTGAENLAPTGIRSPDVQPVASRYTDWAIPVNYKIFILIQYICVTWT
jgi:hypothetical protein